MFGLSKKGCSLAKNIFDLKTPVYLPTSSVVVGFEEVDFGFFFVFDVV